MRTLSLSEDVFKKYRNIFLSVEERSLVEQRMLVILASLQKTMFGQFIRFARVHALNRDGVFY